MATDRNAKVTWPGSLMEGAGTIDGRRERGVRAAGRDLGIARRGAGRSDEPGGADRGRLGSVLLDGALPRARRGRHAARATRRRPSRSRSSPARGSQGRDRGPSGPCPGIDDDGFVEQAEGAEENCPVSKALDGDPRDDARGDPRKRLASRATGARPGRTYNQPRYGHLERARRGARAVPCGARGTARGPDRLRDRREAADLGRRLKELDPPLRAAREWRQASADLADAKGDPELSSLAGELEADVARLEEELRARAGRARSGRREGRDRRGPAGRRGRRGGALGRGRRPHAGAVRRAPRVSHGAPLGERERRGRGEGAGVRGEGRRRVLGLQVGGRHPPCPARPDDRVPGADPHLDRHGRGDARGRGGRGRRSRRRT